jgi:GNAT superfamily N-acetyltransferase
MEDTFSPMLATLKIRPAVPADLVTIGAFVADLGYTAQRDVLLVMLGPMLEDHRHIVLLGEDDAHGVAALLSLSSRPVLRLQGWVGTIEEFVVRPGLRQRGIGERMLLYAKGLAAERGWVRLETVVSRRRESHRRGFLLARGFVQADSVTYRWGPLEGSHQTPPSVARETRSRELV